MVSSYSRTQGIKQSCNQDCSHPGSGACAGHSPGIQLITQEFPVTGELSYSRSQRKTTLVTITQENTPHNHSAFPDKADTSVAEMMLVRSDVNW